MIGKLTGVVDDVYQDYIILEVSGIGYIVYIDEKTKEQLSKGSNVSLHIHSISKEDGIFLYGFNTLQKKEWFLELIKISGISGKIAILILSSLSLSEITNALTQKNESCFLRISGIGKKLANRIVNEMKNIYLTDSDENVGMVNVTDANLRIQAISALTNLGIGKGQATTIVESTMQNNPNADLTSIIKLALQQR